MRLLACRFLCEVWFCFYESHKRVLLKYFWKIYEFSLKENKILITKKKCHQITIFSLYHKSTTIKTLKLLQQSKTYNRRNQPNNSQKPYNSENYTTVVTLVQSKPPTKKIQQLNPYNRLNISTVKNLQLLKPYNLQNLTTAKPLKQSTPYNKQNLCIMHCNSQNKLKPYESETLKKSKPYNTNNITTVKTCQQ